MAKSFSSIHIDANVEIGDFRIERRLGAGGMGVVYLAQQKSLERLVALKVLGAALVHPGHILRFKREAKAAAKLHHPAIATVYCVEQDDFACYMAMEYVEGLTLRQVITQLGSSHDPDVGIETVLHSASAVESKPPRVRFSDLTMEEASDFDVKEEGKLEVALEAITPQAEQLIQSRTYTRRVCEIVRDAALALEHAHQNGVIHRDVKPQNIMLDRQGRVHVIDFGVAHFFDGTVLTETGQLVGTPLYMSPEQVAGRHVDHRSDIYSLGLVMYELLTLRRPLHAPTREAVLRGIVTKEMVPVSWKNTGVPRDVENLVHKAMAKDPDRRYKTAAELAEDLQRFLNGDPVVAESYRYKFDKREIKAERPWGITAAAFWFFLVAAYDAFAYMPLVLLTMTSRPGPGAPLQFQPGYGTVVVGYCTLAIAACTLGWGLLAGRLPARWFGIPVAIVVTGHALKYVVEQVSFAIQRSPGAEIIYDLSVTAQSVVPQLLIFFGGAFVTLLLVSGGPSANWFYFSRQLRTEHDRLRRTTRLRGERRKPIGRSS